MLVGGPSDEQLESFLGIATGRKDLPRPDSIGERGPTEGQLISLVTSLRMESEREMSQYRQRWSLSDAFFADSQWVAWNPKTGQLDTPPRQKGRPRVQVNVFKKWSTNVVARLLSTHPQIIIKPGSADDKIVDAARVATKIIGEHEWQAQDMDEVMSDFIPGFYLHGDGALYVCWNPRGGKYLGKKPKPVRDEQGNRIQVQMPVPEMDPQYGIPMQDPMTGEPVMRMEPQFEPEPGEDGQPIPIWEPEIGIDGQPIMLDEWEGRNETHYVSSHDIFFDPSATKFKDAMWLIVSVNRSPAYIYDRWGVEVQPAPPGRQNDQWRYNRNLRMTQVPKTAPVDELWIKKGRYRFGPGENDVVTLDKGYVVIVAGNRLLDYGPNPYEHGEFPICFERALVNDKIMRGDTPANSLRELNVIINKMCSAIALNLDMMGDIQWLLPTSANMPEADKRNGPGIFKRYDPDPMNPGVKPEPVAGLSPAHGFYDFIGLVHDKFGADMASQHEGGIGGGVPPNIEAGVALEALVERDTTALTQIAAGIGRLIRRWAYLCCKNWQQFVPMKKQITVAGEWNEPEVMTFSGLDIADCFEFSVVPQSVLPQSKAAEFQKSLALFERGIIDAREFMRRTGEDRAETMSEQQKQAANARKENSEVQRTGVITTPPEIIMAVDDAAIHIEEHKSLLLDRKFMRENPAAYKQLLQHVQMFHEPVMMQMQMQQMMMAGGAGPAPGGGGGGGAAPPAPGEGPIVPGGNEGGGFAVPRPNITA